MRPQTDLGISRWFCGVSARVIGCQRLSYLYVNEHCLHAVYLVGVCVPVMLAVVL